MIINWDLAPEGTTHATINGGEPYWYKLEDGKVLCWGHKSKEWMPSFFLTVDEIAETGLRLYANGEQSLLVTLTEQREMLMEALKLARHALTECCNDKELPADGALVFNRAIQSVAHAITMVEGAK